MTIDGILLKIEPNPAPTSTGMAGRQVMVQSI
jgi:hypothetical protein